MTYDRMIRDLEYQELPEELQKNQYYCQNISPAGHSLFKVQLPKDISDKHYYAQLPQKWRYKILFGRGDLCLVTFPENFFNQSVDDTIGQINMLITQKNAKLLVKDGILKDSGFQISEIESEDQTHLNKLNNGDESSDSYY